MKSNITKLSACSALVALMLLGTPAYADDDTASTTDARPTKEEIEERRDAIEAQREERLEQVKENREAIKEERKEQIDAIKAGVEERKEERKMNREERALDFIERVQERFTRIADHMEDIIVRIEERLARLSGRVTTDTAYAELDLAKESIQSARAGIAGLTDLADDLGSASSTPDVVADVRTNIKSVHDSLKEAHGHIVAAVRSVKSVNSEKDGGNDDDDDDSNDDDGDDSDDDNASTTDDGTDNS